MEFGRVSEMELNNVDFSLPAEPAWNKKILRGKPAKHAKVYLGCAKWGRTEWVGKIYPPKTKEKDFLRHYVNHYNAIELNATHYRIWGEAGIATCIKKYKGSLYSSLLLSPFPPRPLWRGLLFLEQLQRFFQRHCFHLGAGW